MLELIREMLEREPFVPFSVVMSSGDRIKVENPDLVAIVEPQLTYYFPRSNGVAHLRLGQIALLQVDDLWA